MLLLCYVIWIICRGHFHGVGDIFAICWGHFGIVDAIDDVGSQLLGLVWSVLPAFSSAIFVYIMS